jgi:hypothetical protein
MSTNGDYQAFLAKKTQLGHGSGFEPIEIPEFLFPFQRQLTEWSIRQGASAIFASMGLGKTPMQLAWADNVVRHTNKPALIITPLAVAYQTEREATKFGFEAKVSRDGTIHKPITITNVERLHYFSPDDFSGAVLDESAMIKAFGGKRRKQVVRFFSKLPYRLLCSGTPSPNDFIELGCQSECLGVMSQSEMLNYFFRETQYMRHTVFREGDFWNTTKWAFKPHSEQPFWRWVSSWARSARLPSDLGFSDDGFILPPLEYVQTIVDVPYIPPGELFPRPAVSLHEQKAERHKTVRERCEKVAELVSDDKPAIVWCDLNSEGLALAEMIPGAVEVAGRHSDDYKEKALNDFALGNFRVLVSKGKIAAWGMNYQHCSHMTFFPTYSFETFAQGIARCHRFGQTKTVRVDIVSSPGEAHVIEGLDIKIKQADRMFAALCKYMNDSESMYEVDRHTKPLELPEWLVGGIGVDSAPDPEPVVEEPQRQQIKRTLTDHTKPLQLPKWLQSISKE